MARKKRPNAMLPSRKSSKKHYYRVSKSSLKQFEPNKECLPENYEKELKELIESMETIRKRYYEQNLQIEKIQKLSLFSIIRSKFQRNSPLKTLDTKSKKQEIE